MFGGRSEHAKGLYQASWITSTERHKFVIIKIMGMHSVVEILGRKVGCSYGNR